MDFSLLVDNKRNLSVISIKNNISCDEVHIRNDKYSVFKKFYNPNLKNMNYFEKYGQHSSWLVAYKKRNKTNNNGYK